jgi:hypothetical protein
VGDHVVQFAGDPQPLGRPSLGRRRPPPGVRVAQHQPDGDGDAPDDGRGHRRPGPSASRLDHHHPGGQRKRAGKQRPEPAADRPDDHRRAQHGEGAGPGHGRERGKRERARTEHRQRDRARSVRPRAG